MLDREGNVVTWNPGAERIKQYRADEIIGQHFSRFYPQEAIDQGWPAHELQVAKTQGRFRTMRAGESARTVPNSGPTSSSRRCTTRLVNC